MIPALPCVHNMQSSSVLQCSGSVELEVRSVTWMHDRNAMHGRCSPAGLLALILAPQNLRVAPERLIAAIIGL